MADEEELLEADDEDLDALRPGLMSRIGGFSMLFTGIFTVVLAAQTYLFVSNLINRWFLIAPLLMLLLGVGCGYLGWKAGAMRGWASIGATATGGFLTIFSLAWLVLSFSIRLFSLLALALVPLAFLATLLVAITIPAGLRADKARFRLQAKGWKMGF